MESSDHPANLSSHRRAELLRIYAAAVGAVAPERVVLRALRGKLGDEVPAAIERASRIRLLAVGKASSGMASAAASSLGDKLYDRLVIAPAIDQSSSPDSKLRVLWAAHPLPDASSELAGRAALHFVASVGSGESLLFLLSGGASALMVAPAVGVTLADKVAVTASLLRSGATIRELNAVRKHLSATKGGGLLRALNINARVVSLILSDVPGNDLGTIGSGPTVADPTSFADAIAILKRRKTWGRTPENVRDRLERGLAGELPETLKGDDPALARASHLIVGDNGLALDAMAAAAQELGYKLERHATLEGEAELVGRDLAQHLEALGSERVCVIAGGEPVVTVAGAGRGGRAQHCALAMALELGHPSINPNIAALFAGTDGIDGPTDAAGAIVTPATLRRAHEAGLDPYAALARCDSYPFFKALGDLIVTGPTGTNVADIFVALIN